MKAYVPLYLHNFLKKTPVKSRGIFFRAAINHCVKTGNIGTVDVKPKKHRYDVWVPADALPDTIPSTKFVSYCAVTYYQWIKN